MSPLFRHSDAGGDEAPHQHGHLPSLFGLGSQVDEAVSRAAALPLHAFLRRS